MRGLEPPGAPIIAPGETFQEARAPETIGVGDLYAVHALEEIWGGSQENVQRVLPECHWKFVFEILLVESTCPYVIDGSC